MARAKEIDFLKFVCILLMIAFHLVYIEEKYPSAKAFVYLFHMPVFLIISGYFAKIDSTRPGKFLHRLLGLFLPYFIMEASYIVMASLLPIREHIDQLTPSVFIDKLLLNPLGPYWYLHTLIVSYLVFYATDVICKKKQPITYIIIAGFLLYSLAFHAGLLSTECSVFILLGLILQKTNTPLTNFFKPTLLAAIPLVYLFLFSADIAHSDFRRIIVVYLVVSTLLALYPHLPSTQKNQMSYIGANTLPILLFSPIFTFLSKFLVPFLSFDPTGLLFLCFSLVIVVSGSLFVAFCLDKSHLSKLLFRKQLLTAPEK